VLSRIVVVGGSAAGLTAIETLRREGYEGSIVVVSDEAHSPYDRPPLSKQVLSGAWEPTKAALRPPPALEALDVDWRFQRRAVSLDLARRVVHLSDDTELEFDGLVIATGVAPRRLGAGHELAGVHTLRSIDDAAALRGGLISAKSLVVVGAGFLGAEVAAVARSMGVEVTMVDPLAAPMIRPLGPYVGDRLAALHREHGVDVRCGIGVVGLGEHAGGVSDVVLTDGSTITADVVLVAIGSIPAVGWLEGSGLSLTDGVDCNEFCEAADGVVAAGDVASWIHPEFGRLRVEHRMNATEQGMAAAKTLLGRREPFRPVSYFWSDQYTVKVQAYGLTGGDARFHLVDEVAAEGKFCGVYEVDGRVVGALTWNMPTAARTLRPHVVDRSAIANVGGAS
jgi:3-phenylpropionate/trans-cinnamate dioxygenase ferredoxin reductase component